MGLKRKGPLQTSKVIGCTLLNEEVEAWHALEAYLFKNGASVKYPNNPEKFSQVQVLRGIMRMAVEVIAQETGDRQIVDKLSLPRAIQARNRRTFKSTSASSSSAAKRKRRPPLSKEEAQAAAKEGRRIYWDRSWKGPSK